MGEARDGEEVEDAVGSVVVGMWVNSNGTPMAPINNLYVRFKMINAKNEERYNYMTTLWHYCCKAMRDLSNYL